MSRKKKPVSSKNPRENASWLAADKLTPENSSAQKRDHALLDLPTQLPSSISEPPYSRSLYRNNFLAALLLAVLPLVAYLPLLEAGFIWDDEAYVTENQQLRTNQGLFNIWFVPLSIPQYYPLVHTSFWIEYQLWGLNPLGYHVVNVVLHAISGLLLWRLLVRLGVPGAWLAAALFSVHPVMVESVAWVTERKNVLSLCLALASILCYLRFEQIRLPDSRIEKDISKSWWYYGASGLLFLGALFSKTVVCTLPAVILVLGWWKRGQIPWRSLRALAPFLILGIGLGLVTAWLEKHHVGARGDEWSLASLDRILLAGRVLWFYAGKLVWPEPLIFFYPRWTIDSSQAWQYLFPAAALAVVIALWATRKTIGRGPLAAVLIFTGVLFPALGFFDVYPFRYSFVADHFQYHASLALIALLAAGLHSGLALLGRITQRQARTILTATATALIVMLSTLTFRQSRAYDGLESIYKDTLAKNPAAWGASCNLANYYLSLGKYDEALAVAEQGLGVSSQIADVHNTMGAVLMKASLAGAYQDAGLLDKTVEYFSASLKIQPKYHEAHFNLAAALSMLERHEEAIVHYERLLELIPEDVEGKAGLAKSLIATGQVDQALPMLESVLSIRPSDATALHGMGLVEAQQGHFDKAVHYFEVALKSDGDLIGARFDLAGALMAKGELKAARDQYLLVIERQNWNIRARNNLGVIYMNLSEPKKAIEQFSQAVALVPEYHQAKENLERAQQSLNTP